MKRPILFFYLWSIATAAFAGNFQLKDGWIRLLPAGVPAAGYFALRNDTRQRAELVAASSPAYGDVMIHMST